MTGMLDWGDVLEFVVDGLNEGALAQENFVGHAQEDVLHGVLNLGDQVDRRERKKTWKRKKNLRTTQIAAFRANTSRRNIEGLAADMRHLAKEIR